MSHTKVNGRHVEWVVVLCCSVVATPGRFMHVVVEMNLKLQSVEYVVFDEADRCVHRFVSKHLALIQLLE